MFFVSFCLLEKPERTFSVTVTIISRKYDPAYDDISSQKSLFLIAEITTIIVPFCKRKFRFFVAIRIIRFFPGSVGVDYDLVFEPTSNVTNNSIVEEFQTANGTKELEFLLLGKVSAREVVPTTPTVTTVTTLPTGKKKKKNNNNNNNNNHRNVFKIPSWELNGKIPNNWEKLRHGIPHLGYFWEAVDSLDVIIGVFGGGKVLLSS